MEHLGCLDHYATNTTKKNVSCTQYFIDKYYNELNFYQMTPNPHYYILCLLSFKITLISQGPFWCRCFLEHEMSRFGIFVMYIQSWCEATNGSNCPPIFVVYQIVFNFRAFVQLQTWKTLAAILFTINGQADVAHLAKYPGQPNFHQKIVYGSLKDWLTDWPSKWIYFFAN